MSLMSPRVFEILSAMTPFDINCGKIRVGNERDGGYILADIPSSQEVVSFGVGPDVTFEYELASKGRRVFLHDHTVATTPVVHDNFDFRKVGICGEGMETPELLPLREHLARIGDLSDHSVLKLDVEGYEWDVFSTLSNNDLSKFDQIVVELHWFERLNDLLFARTVLRSLNNLNKEFSLFHVHANNCVGLHIVDGFTVASVIEASYVRTSKIVRTTSKSLYPSPLNKANTPEFHDHVLLFYPFVPTSISSQYARDLVTRVDREYREAQGGTTQQLVNIAPEYIYRVSSKFMDSQPAPFALRPTGNCHFHTDLEDTPWILFELDMAFPVERIVVHNRSDACQERAQSIAVSVSLDGSEFTTVYAPSKYVTPGSGENALRINVDIDTHIQFVKLFLRERNYFHLDCVEILVPRDSMATKYLSPLASDAGVTKTADDPTLGTLVGTRVGSTITVKNSESGIVLFGGYYALLRGCYRAIIWLSRALERSGNGKIEIYSPGRDWILCQRDFSSKNLSSDAPFIDIEFSLFQDINELEVRLLANPGLTLTITSVEVVKLDDFAQIAEPKAPLRQPGGSRRPLNILYYSCHEILAFDELRMLTDRGHRVLSLGNYTNPNALGHLRKPLPRFFYPGDWDRYSSEGITPDFAREFDLAIVMHDASKVREIFSIRPDMPVIYRSIGQSNRAVEEELRPFEDRIKVVRYSERERSLSGFLPAEDVIYFGKEMEDFAEPWRGGSRILTFHNAYPLRNYASVPPLELYLDLSKTWPCDLYGAGNDEVRGSAGVASPERQLELYRESALYLYVYTIGPSYTLSFMEAMGTGLPIVAPSAAMVEQVLGRAMVDNSSFLEGPGRYEVEELLGNDPALIYSSLEEAHEKIGWLMANQDYRVEVSHRLRSRFKNMFDSRKLVYKWEDLMYKMVS